MISFGAIKIMPVDAFFADQSATSLIDEYNEYIGTPQLPITTRDWPKITRSIKSESFFILSVSSPALEGSIRFDSTGSTEGRYDLKIHSQRIVENGTIVNVKSIPDGDASQHPFTGLQAHHIRFFVKTSAANDRQGTERVWLIGISAYKDAEIVDSSTSSG